MKKQLYIFFILFFLAFKADHNKSGYNIPIATRSIFITDIDMDIGKDIVVGHGRSWQGSNKSISILTNNKKGYFSITDTSKSFCGHQKNIFAVKINNDEYPDLVTFYSDFSTGVVIRYIRIFYNEEGEYNNFTDFPLNSSETFTTINYGDINGDGFLDLVVISNLGRFYGVLYNDGYGNFSSPQYYNITFPPSDIVTGDLNNDGRDDIIIGGSVEILFSKPDGFQSFSTDVVVNRLKLSDFDNDGDLDIIGAINLFPTTYHKMEIIENLGDQEFLIHDPFFFEPICDFQFVASDFNNDSLPDLLFHTYDQQNLMIFYNKGNFILSDPVFIPIINYGESAHQSACADLDGNGYNDIVTIRGWGTTLPANVNIFFNDGDGKFVENPFTAIDEPYTQQEETKIKCYPNPFNTETSIEFEINKAMHINISIFNLNGEKIITITDDDYMLGKYRLIWNAKDKNGKEVNSGLYIVHLRLGRKTITKQLALIR